VRTPAGLIATILLLAGCTAAPADPSEAAPPPASASGSASPAGAPALDVAVVVDGLDHAWDVVQAPDGTLLVDERSGGFTAVLPDGTVRPVQADVGDLYAQGETGLMGLALDPAFEENRRLYSCQGVVWDGRTALPTSIAVITWTVSDDWTTATRVVDPLVGGLPANERSGRHGGCRLRFAPDGVLLVGTGDTARGDVAQDPRSLGGKVLRVDPASGEREVWTLGHRNVQGLAVRPGSDQVFAVEHGPDRDDEVNLLQPGGNYGWDPDGNGSYDESVPMTDETIEGAVPAVWSSGSPTLATSGAAFLDGEQWGAYDDLLLVGLLKARGVLALRLDDVGALVEQFRVPELDGTFGRIRSVLQGVDGALYLTTDNGDDEDAVLRVTPRS
jgi:glucose/arabinose dehydrogenase